MLKKVLMRLLVNTRVGSMFIPKRSLMRYLKEIGWYQSYISGMPLDKGKQPIPWYTYGAIAFLEERLRKEMSIFEYGSGNSTLWWSDRVSKVISCEHDNEWFHLMKPKAPSNVDYKLINLVINGEYSKEILNFNKLFDVVVIDGRDRVHCASNTLEALKPDGVIVWDNSDRERYTEGYNFLQSSGFKRLDFSGLGPVNTRGWCTSIFYRTDNCLGI